MLAPGPSETSFVQEVYLSRASGSHSEHSIVSFFFSIVSIMFHFSELPTLPIGPRNRQ